MLMSDKQIAINEVIVKCRELADYYREAAEILEDTELSDLFRELSRQHEGAAEDVEKRIREKGELPKAPDADREAVELVLSRLKATLSEDERATLLEEREQIETDLAEYTDKALQEDLSEKTRSLLERIRNDAVSAKERLRAMRAKS